MPNAFFVSDLHGRTDRYRSLWQAITREKPRGVFLGGDLLPHPMDMSWRRDASQADFLADYLVPQFAELRDRMGPSYPEVFLIFGNDDPAANEPVVRQGEDDGLWHYVHGKTAMFASHPVLGYACIPPSPFQLKDWERYDVSRFVDPGCLAPEEGSFSVDRSRREIKLATIAGELASLADARDLSQAICLFHCPPHGGRLDLADLAGKMVDHAPLDPHIGSIAIQRFIRERQPLLTLHGHVHENRRLTGNWQEKTGPTLSFNAANDTPELALVRFDPDHPEQATLELIAPQSNANG